MATLHAQTQAVLLAWGLQPDCAGTAAAAMVYTDVAGIESHGISMLPLYEELRAAGDLDPGARPRTIRQTAVTAVVDAGGGLGHPAAMAAMHLAADKAQAAGVGVVSVRNSHHFGAAGQYAAVAAERGLIGPVTTSALVQRPGLEGLSPLGGTGELSSHKGYGLAVMVRILSATLCGAAFAAAGEEGRPVEIGHFFLALDPAAFRDDGGFEDDLDDALDLLRATPPADPEQPVLRPGDPEAAAREQRLRDGVPLSEVLIGQLRGICERAGAPFLLDVPAGRSRQDQRR